jgi:hypothetical protein
MVGKQSLQWFLLWLNSQISLFFILFLNSFLLLIQWLHWLQLLKAEIK